MGILKIEITIEVWAENNTNQLYAMSGRSTFVVVVDTRTHAVDGEQLFRCVSYNGQHVTHEPIDVSTARRLVNDVFVVVVS